LRRLSRVLRLLLGLSGAVVCGYPSCYRAELDFSQSYGSLQGGEGGATSGAGGAGEGCYDFPLDSAQRDCQTGVLPTLAECTDQDVEGWSGCYAGGCAVCTKSLREYPHYFNWHPCCEPNSTCGSNSPVKCNSRCPAPTERDKRMPCFLER
jgi:hypothetical protein